MEATTLPQPCNEIVMVAKLTSLLQPCLDNADFSVVYKYIENILYDLLAYDLYNAGLVYRHLGKEL